MITLMILKLRALAAFLTSVQRERLLTKVDGKLDRARNVENYLIKDLGASSKLTALAINQAVENGERRKLRLSSQALDTVVKLDVQVDNMTQQIADLGL